MTPSLFSPRSLLRSLLAWAALTFVVLACGSSAGAPAGEPASVPTFSLTPAATSEITIPVTGGAASTPLPAIPEKRRLTLEFPAQIRAGDADIVRLTLEVDDQGNLTPTAQVQGNVISGETIEIPNLYATHHVIAEARFDIAGLQVSPPDLISQTLSQGQSLNFFWSVRPQETGLYRGTVWLYLRFVEKNSGAESRRAVSAQIVEIEAVNILGLPARLLRTVGGVGSFIGAVIGFPFFEDIVKFLFGRLRKKPKI